MTRIFRRLLTCSSIFAFALAVLLCAANAAFGQPSSNPSKIMDQYRSQRIQWTTNIWPYANTLFGLLAVIEFAWSAAVMLLEKTDLQSWTAALIRKVMWIGAFYALLLNGRLWIPWIIQSFEQIGETASGVAALSPSAVFSQGLNIAGALMDSASTSAFFTKPGSSLALVFAALIIVMSYGIITLQFIVAMVESYIIVAAGFIFVGFGGSRWTVPYTERYIGLAVSTGVKIMLLYLLIGAGFNFAVDWQVAATTVATSGSPMMSAFDIMGAAMIFMMLCWQIPKLFSAVLGGSPALTGGDLLATTTGLVAGAAAIGTFAAGGAALAARGAAALGGISSAAAAGAGESSVGCSVKSLVSAARMSGGYGGTGSGTVPPPSLPPSGASSNGPPRQPDPPPINRSSAGATPEVAGSSASNVTAAFRNGSGKSGSSQGNANDVPSERSALSTVGGDSLAGSGFETERPAAGFTSVTGLVRNSGAPYVPPPLDPVRSGSGTDAASGEVTSSATPRAIGRFADAEVVARTIQGTSAAGGNRPLPSPNGSEALAGQKPHNSAASVRSVHSNGRADQQPPASKGLRERIASTARNADQAFSGAANRLRGLRNQLGGLPSDAAPHTPPPRMPIDHHD
jgi:type IV secretion system protein TrbL